MSIADGQKANATNFNNAFVSKTTQTTKGDLIGRTTTGPERVPVGANGDVLVADSTQSTGVAYSGRLTAAEGDISTLQSDVGALQSDVSTLQSDVSTLQTDINNKADTDLGNLAATSINADLDPSAPNARDFGDDANFWRLMKLVRVGTSANIVSFTGDTTSGSPTITNVSAVTGLYSGNILSIIGSGAPDATTISSFASGPNTVTMDQNATATASGVTFYAVHALFVRSENQTGANPSGMLLTRTGNTVDGKSGPQLRRTGNATGTGASGDIIDSTGTTSSGLRGAILQTARFTRLPNQSADPSSPLNGAIYYNTTSNVFRFYNGTTWADVGSGGSFVAASQAEMEAATSTTVGVTPGRQQFHPSAAKVWVQWIGSTVLASYNVSSVTDNGNADQTINFTAPFSSANYSIAGCSGLNATSMRAVCQQYNAHGPATGSCRLQIIQSDGLLSARVRGQAVFYGDQ